MLGRDQNLIRDKKKSKLGRMKTIIIDKLNNNNSSLKATE